MGRIPSKQTTLQRKLHVEKLECRRVFAALLGASPSSDGLWDGVDSMIQPGAGQVSYLRAQDYALYTLNSESLGQVVSKAPLEFISTASQQPTITLPTPDGNYASFRIVDSPIMEPGLSAKYPNIRTYAGQGITDPAAKLRFDVTPSGFHAQVLSPNGAYYVDPYFHLDGSYYASYFLSSVVGAGFSESDLVQDTGNNNRLSGGNSSGTNNSSNGRSDSRSGSELRSYRLAVAATGEYTNFFGGTVAGGLASIVTAMNRINGIYESDLSIRMVLVANNDLIVYTNGANDPYTDGDDFTIVDENQVNVDNVIGDANYDIGHVFQFDGAGFAPGNVGRSGQKASATTGAGGGTPAGDAFWVDYVAHEIGHQFNANHTFNGEDGACGARWAPTAYETGSGSTIMSYAGICATDDIQPHSDPAFHSISFDEIIDYVENDIPNVGTRIQTGNTIPVVDAGKNYTIPARTPFVLTASGRDGDATDALSYSWEQRDLGPSQNITDPDNGTSPLMRPYAPTTDPSRVVPRLTDLVNNRLAPGEQLPTTNRLLNFRATVRDNRINGGGVNTDDVTLTVRDTGAPFAVIAPNTNVSWEAFSTQSVTWNVAGTTANGIDTPNVDISLSTDGGLTYPIVLATGVPNDGSHDVVIPNLQGTTNRIRVQGSGNIFFDISNADFTIAAPLNTSDYGDAPATYGTTAANNGANHVAGSLFLGTAIDTEADGVPTPSANGDGQDEDGIVFVNPLVSSTTSVFEVTSSGAGVLDYFFDFDGSGSFANNPDEVFRANVVQGKQLVPVVIPATAVAQTFARFRLSTSGNLGPRGTATTGEVEDYQVTIAAPPPVISLGPGAGQYLENSPALFIAPQATLSDPARTNFPNATLTVTIASGGDAADIIRVVSNGTGQGQVNLTTTNVQFSGQNIGTWSIVNNVFTATFNAQSTLPGIQALYRQFTFETPSDSPVPGNRSIVFNLSGSFGSVTATRIIQVVALNDPPVIGNAILQVDEDTPTPQGGRLSVLYQANFRDPDLGSAMSGIAIVGNPLNAIEGSWHFSSDNGLTWREIGDVDDASQSLVLSVNSLVGFLPAPDYYGIPQSLEVRALDNTYSNTFSNSRTDLRVFLDTSLRRPDGPVGLTKSQMIARVRNINDAPIATQTEISLDVLQDDIVQYQFPADLFLDTDSAFLNYSIDGVIDAVPSWIQFDPVTQTITGTPRNADVGMIVLEISATDSSQARTSIPLTINVGNVNDPPSPIVLKNITLAEETAGATVGAISSVDPDVGDSITWSVSDSRFVVTGGVLKLRDNFAVNFETERSIRLIINATDSGVPQRITTLDQIIDVVDTNESFPELASSTFTVSVQHDIADPIATLVAPDADIFQTVVLEVLPGTDGSKFLLDPISGELRFAPGVVLDYVQKPSYEFFVKATDNGVPSRSRTALIRVEIAKFNASGPTVPNQTFATPENPVNRVVVGRIQGTDLDGDSLASFNLLTVGSPFEVNPLSGEVSVAVGAKLDFEMQSTYVLQVLVGDSGVPSKSSTGIITVNIGDKNDPPTAISSLKGTLPINQFGYVVSDLKVVDQDPSTQYIYTTQDPLFEVRNGKIALRPNVSLDSSLVGKTINIPVTVVDAFDPTSRADLNLRFTVVDNPSPWQNPLQRLDVNRDGKVSPADSLTIINSLNEVGRRALSAPRLFSEMDQPDYDVNGDGVISPADSLMVVNFLNLGGTGGEGEGRLSNATPVENATYGPWLNAFEQLEQEWSDRRKNKR